MIATQSRVKYIRMDVIQNVVPYAADSGCNADVKDMIKLSHDGQEFGLGKQKRYILVLI